MNIPSVNQSWSIPDLCLGGERYDEEAAPVNVVILAGRRQHIANCLRPSRHASAYRTTPC
jgi:hypothetical protein